MKIFLVLISSAQLVSGQGITLWNEAMNGPLSHNENSPTFIGTLQVGTNAISGQSEIVVTGESAISYEDYFSFNVPPSLQVVGINLLADRSVTAYFPFSNTHVTTSASTTVLLALGVSAIPEGSYAFRMGNYDFQPFNNTIADYRLDFIVTPVPEPSTWALVGLAGAVSFAARRKTSVA